MVIEPQQSYIEIHNKQNSNGITVVCDGDRTELEEGLTTTIDDTATITVGYQTEFRLSVKREAKTEINVGGDVSGDVVAGDQERTERQQRIAPDAVRQLEAAFGEVSESLF